MREEMVTAKPGDGVAHLLTLFMEHSGSSIFVINESGALSGIITADQIRPIMKDAVSLEGLVIAQDLMVEGRLPTVDIGDSLADVMRQLGGYRGEVAVLEGGRLAGVIWPEDVIGRYNTEIFKRDMAQGVATAVDRGDPESMLTLEGGAVIAEIPTPPSFAERTIKELEIRRRFGVSILMIKREHAGDGEKTLDASPTADYVFQPGDIMLVMGPRTPPSASTPPIACRDPSGSERSPRP
jgi:hypothetical protein